MRLRIIVMVLSVLAFMSAATGGYLYYNTLKASAIAQAGKESASRAKDVRERFSSFLIEQAKPVKVLAKLEEIRLALSEPTQDTMAKADRILDLFNESLDTSVCYLMDLRGVTRASSNRDQPDSFVGKDFSFRPYFQEAVRGRPTIYMALGTASGRRGVYYSYPVLGEEGTTVIGVAVIKATIEPVEKELNQGHEEIILLTDPHGIVFVSTHRDWLFHSLTRLSSEEMLSISNSRQFGEGPFPWTGLEIKGEDRAIDQSGNEYLSYRMPVDGFPGWSVVYLQDLAAMYKRLSDPLFGITTSTVLALCVLVGLSVSLLYRKASEDIVKRRLAEEALRESERRYRHLYHNTPGMLHSVDPEGRLVSVSDYWLDSLGYRRHEVIGKRLSDFLTQASRRYADEVVFPAFLEKGYCRDVSYQFRKKDGQTIEVLLSAIAERDVAGKVQRSLSVLVDVTEQKRAEEELRVTREQLRRYSEDLERQVAERTGVITGILRHTPSVVFLKDTQYRYVLVNSRFEQVFGMTEEQIRGKTDYEIFREDIADQFRANDRKVVAERRAYQIEERVPHEDGMSVYLSAKFPLYDEEGSVRSICGIATDITAIKKAQDQLRRLSGSIMAGQEKERTAIARELHDELGQVLTALKIDSVWLRERLKHVDAEAAKQAAAMCLLIDKTIDDVRGIALRLRPGVLDDLGLIPALEWYIGDFERRTRICCDFQHADVPNVRNIVATAAYRVAQEALTNAARHAHAARITVSLEVTDGILVLTVEDNGSGFNILELGDSEGLGIAGMRERAALVGGAMEIESRQAMGTRVVFNVPLDTVDGVLE